MKNRFLEQTEYMVSHYSAKRQQNVPGPVLSLQGAVSLPGTYTDNTGSPTAREKDGMVLSAGGMTSLLHNVRSPICKRACVSRLAVLRQRKIEKFKSLYTPQNLFMEKLHRPTEILPTRPSGAQPFVILTVGGDGI
jgi:hypothetical protein